MKHGFLIMAHTNWNQLKKLLYLLDDSRNSIYIHVDAAAKDFDSSQFVGLLHHASLEFVPRSKVTWGGVSQIECEISLIKSALKKKCDYYHLISGMDLPLHNMDYIDDFFERNKGKEFVHFTEYGQNVNSGTRDRIALYHPFQEVLGRKNNLVDFFLSNIQKICCVDRMRGNRDIILGKGANWFSLSYSMTVYFYKRWLSVKKFFSSSVCADEIVLQTIILNSPYRGDIYHLAADDNYQAIMRYIDWNRGCPYVFRVGDFNELIHSPMLFARKFDESVDSQIVDMLTEYLVSH